MLSHNLKSLFEHFRTYVDTGLELQPEAVFTICAILESSADDALELEAHRMLVAVIPHDQPPNVISMATVRARTGAAHADRPAGPGDVA